MTLTACVITRWWIQSKRQTEKSTTWPKIKGDIQTKYEDSRISYPYVTADRLIPNPGALICCHNSLHSSWKTISRDCETWQRGLTHSQSQELQWSQTLTLGDMSWISVRWVFLTKLTECTEGTVTWSGKGLFSTLKKKKKSWENLYFQDKCHFFLFKTEKKQQKKFCQPFFWKKTWIFEF